MAYLGLVAAAGCRGTRAAGTPLADPELEHGRQVYFRNCVPCHGESGHGDGPVALSQSLPPRDFVRGDFKYSSGGPGKLPSEADLLHTVTFGPPTMAMPAFSSLDLADRVAVVKYVESLCPRYARER